jgi:hypothetical protein
VTEALDFLEPHIRPERLIPQFRFHLRSGSRIAEARKRQQQVLCATLPGIRDSVKELIGKQMDPLARRLAATHDMKVKEEIDRLSSELVKLDKLWRFLLIRDNQLTVGTMVNVTFLGLALCNHSESKKKGEKKCKFKVVTHLG